MVLRIIRDLLGGVLLFWVLGIGPLCWILRDGLGPKSMESHGLAAVARFFFTFYWGPVLVVLAGLCLLCHRGSREKNDESGIDLPP